MAKNNRPRELYQDRKVAGGVDDETYLLWQARVQAVTRKCVPLRKLGISIGRGCQKTIYDKNNLRVQGHWGVTERSLAGSLGISPTKQVGVEGIDFCSVAERL